MDSVDVFFKRAALTGQNSKNQEKPRKLKLKVRVHLSLADLGERLKCLQPQGSSLIEKFVIFFLLLNILGSNISSTVGNHFPPARDSTEIEG
jgi:hypothetical protein